MKATLILISLALAACSTVIAPDGTKTTTIDGKSAVALAKIVAAK